MNIINQVIVFLNDPEEVVVEVYDGILRVFMRKAKHLNSDLKLVDTLDIANIYCKNQGQGIFTKFIDEVEKISPYPIYIESVLNHDRLGKFLIKRGYKFISLKGCNSYFLDNT